MGKHLIHGARKRSWWDGSIVGYCGYKAKAGEYKTTWGIWATINCPACLAAMKREGVR